ncbi:hypothetical protein OEZ86_012511 [Tetradesmus obliquus]|nr:hypothetical protein OEZ86_012511 [Tetradesmus obliquus]
MDPSTAFEGPKLRIKLARTGDLDAAAAAPLVAAAYLVRMYSAVAMQLPETDEWDLSGLLLDGQPVSRDTVVAWLNAAYQNILYETYFEEQQDGPACSVDGLYKLLAFADAVDSTRPLMKACCTCLQHLQLYAQLGQQVIALQTDGRAYACVNGTVFERADILSAAHAYRPDPEVPAEQQDAFRQQVAAQTERLLWLSYKLQLEPLIQRLHAFLHLPGGKRMLMNSVMGEVAQIAGLLGDSDDAQTLLQPQALTQAQRQPLKFDAVVVRSGLPVASGATVPVELDLFRTSQIKLGQQVYPVQLRIGRYIQSDS